MRCSRRLAHPSSTRAQDAKPRNASAWWPPRGRASSGCRRRRSSSTRPGPRWRSTSMSGTTRRSSRGRSRRSVARRWASASRRDGSARSASVRQDGRRVLLETGDVCGGFALARFAGGVAREAGLRNLSSSPARASTTRRCDGVLARRSTPWTRAAAVSRIGPKLLVARYLGASAAEARAAFAALWAMLRPAVAGRSAVAPRIWAT